MWELCVAPLGKPFPCQKETSRRKDEYTHYLRFGLMLGVKIKIGIRDPSTPVVLNITSALQFSVEMKDKTKQKNQCGA